MKNAVVLLMMVGWAAAARAAEVTTISMSFSDETAAVALAAGRVFEDRNGNGTFEPNADVPVAKIAVSDGDAVVQSGMDGKYSLPLSGESQVVFITQPANYERQHEFYRLLPDDFTSGSAGATGAGARPRTFEYNFLLKPAPRPDTANFRFVQTTDIHIGGEADRERFRSALEEINQLAPPADFLIATGDLINSGDRLSQFEIYTSVSRTCRIPYFHVFGNHDANKGTNKVQNYHQFLGPDYYSADYGDMHLVMLNSVHPSERQDRWLERDLRMLGRGKRVLAFQHYPPREKELQKFQAYGIRAVFSGHWHSNKITSHENGLVSVNQPTFIMGGIDGSAASFRIVSIYGQQINSEFRIADFDKRLTITYPQDELSGPERLVANIYDSSAGVREARFRIQNPQQPPIAQGDLKQVSPLSWMAPLDAERLGVQGGLPSQFTVRVRATNNRGEQWEASQQVARVVQKGGSAAPVQLGADWPEFMGNAQRTGVSRDGLAPPLKLAWMTPTHGSIDWASPVQYKGRVAMTVKDRDNLINNGVWLLDAKKGTPIKFIPTDSMVNGSAAFAEDTEDGPGKVYVVSVGGSIYVINPEDGEIESRGKLADTFQQRWIYGSPAVQGHLAVLGSSAALVAMQAQFGEQKWMNNFGVDWISCYGSPTLAGDTVVMTANWLDKEGKPASIYALDADHGQLKWVNPCPGTHSSVAAFRGRGFATDDAGVLRVIDLSTGADLTTRSLGKGNPMSTPAVDEEIVVAPGGGGEVHAFDPGTLVEKWVFRSDKGLWNMAPYDKTSGAVFSSPTISGRYVYIGCSDGKLYALDKGTGDVRWFYNFGVPTLASPCVSGNTLITAAYDGNVYAFTGVPVQK